MKRLLLVALLASCGYQRSPYVPDRNVAFCGNGCTTSRTCAEGTSCGQCVGNTCTTAVPFAPEPDAMSRLEPSAGSTTPR